MSALKSDLPTFSGVARGDAGVRGRGGVARCRLCGRGRREPPASTNRCWALALLALAIGTSAAKIELPLGRSHSNLSLSHVVNFWALFALGPAEAVVHRHGERLGAVHAARRRPQPDAPHPLQHRFADGHGRGGGDPDRVRHAVRHAGPGDAWFARRRGRRAALLLREHGAGRGGDRAVDAPADGRASGSATSSGARRAIWPARALAAVAAASSARGWFGWLALLAVPLYLVFRSYHTVVARLREEQEETRRAMEVQLATIEALALAIEAKAGCTPEHMRSIQQYAATLAEAAGLSDRDVQAVRTAALLHDIGNMAVPEHILSKPDALTPEEFERVKIHPRVGADILRNVPFGAPVGELVLCHHERWDGLGYPAGLRGEDIPLGARILAIADCYSTLQADRPYRPARSQAEAVAVLREYAGTAFDPALVDMLIARLDTSAEAAAAAADAESAWTQDEPTGAAGHRRRASRGADALRDRAGARLEPRRRRRDGADSGEGQPPGAVHHLRAVPRRRRTGVRLPLRARPRHRGAVQVDAEVVERHRAAAAVDAPTVAAPTART